MRLPNLTLLALLALWAASAPAAIVTFNVNETADRPDDITNGACADAFGKCTLRAAIMEANLSANPDGYLIKLPAGTYTLTRAVANPDDHSNGDLDVSAAMVVQGSDAATTIIDANHVDRAFKVSSSGYLILNDVTIRNGQDSTFGGRPSGGGAILSHAGINVSRCVFDSNTSVSEGGAIAAYTSAVVPLVIVAQTTFSRNVSAAGGGGFYGDGVNTSFDACTFSSNKGSDGGGIESLRGSLQMQNSTLYQNDAASDGGGIYIYATTGNLRNLTLGGNGVDSDLDNNGSGGGLYADASSVAISNSVFSNVNDNTHGNDDCYTTHGASMQFTSGMVLRSLAGCTYTGFAYEGDPLLGPLKNNGGPTFTSIPSSDLVIDMGTPGGCAGINGTLTVDQRGVKRPIGANCDAGAVEVEPVGDVNGDGSRNVADVLYLINFLFAGGPVPKGRANVNGGTTVDVADVLYLINFLFASGPAPI